MPTDRGEIPPAQEQLSSARQLLPATGPLAAPAQTSVQPEVLLHAAALMHARHTLRSMCVDAGRGGAGSRHQSYVQ